MIKQYSWFERFLLSQTNIILGMFVPEKLMETQKAKYASAMEFNIALRIIPQLNRRLTDREKFEWFLTREQQVDWLALTAKEYGITELERTLERSKDSIHPVALYDEFITDHEHKTVVNLQRENISWTLLNDVLTPMKGEPTSANEVRYTTKHAPTAQKVLEVLFAVIGNSRSSTAEIQLTRERDHYKLYNGMPMQTIYQLSHFMSYLFRLIPEEKQENLAIETHKRVNMRMDDEPRIWVGAGIYAIITGTHTLNHPEVFTRTPSTKPCNISYRLPPTAAFYALDGSELNDAPSKVRDRYIFGKLMPILNQIGFWSITKTVMNEYAHFTNDKLGEKDSVYGLWSGKPLIIYNLIHSVTHLLYELAGIVLGAIAACAAFVSSVIGRGIYNYFDDLGSEPQKFFEKIITLVERRTGHSFTISRAGEPNAAEIAELKSMQSPLQRPAAPPVSLFATGTGISVPPKIREDLLKDGVAAIYANLFKEWVKDTKTEFVADLLPSRFKHNTELINKIYDYLEPYTEYHAIEAAARMTRKSGVYSGYGDNPTPQCIRIAEDFTEKRREFQQYVYKLCGHHTHLAEEIISVPAEIFMSKFGIFTSQNRVSLPAEGIDNLCYAVR